MTRTILNVRGMHCQSCKMLAEDVLGDLEGVNSVNADVDAGTIEVEYDEGRVSEDQIKEEINNETDYSVE